ncbi:hypothetical protein BKA70DRAFT_1370371 [Coprinopsis sp. MPI-PUGE-AT-0042]|nr:hypothetical protein BKA70DRAFT_1370371 [Coprinopsis sp. MPI-PUGE-AT-0042]
MVAFFREAWFLGKPAWTVDDIPDLTDMVIIVTGGNSGIGLQTVRALLKRNARVYIASRSVPKSLAIIEELYAETGQRAQFLELDLANLDSIESAAAEFKRKETRLDILFNNAGRLSLPIEVTANGYDPVFHTNVLGPFYFTKLLLPLLLQTAKLQEGAARPRVVNVTSSAHHFAGVPMLDFNSFKDGPGRRKHTDLDHFYSQSKAAIIVFSNELARQYGDMLVSVSVNPGNFRTALTRDVHDRVRNLFTKYLLYHHPDEWSCITQLWAGLAPDADQFNGKYVIPWGKAGKPRPETEDSVLAKELWTWLEEQVEGRALDREGLDKSC